MSSQLWSTLARSCFYPSPNTGQSNTLKINIHIYKLDFIGEIKNIKVIQYISILLLTSSLLPPPPPSPPNYYGGGGGGGGGNIPGGRHKHEMEWNGTVLMRSLQISERRFQLMHVTTSGNVCSKQKHSNE